MKRECCGQRNFHIDRVKMMGKCEEALSFLPHSILVIGSQKAQGRVQGVCVCVCVCVCECACAIQGK